MSFRGKTLIKKETVIYAAIFLLGIQYFDEVSFLYLLDQTKLKHVLVLLVCFWGLYPDIDGLKLRIKNFSYELSHVCCVTLCLVAISFVYMFFNGFSTGWISESYYLLVPVFFAYSIFKDDCSTLRIERMMNMFLFSLIFGYSFFIFEKIAAGNLSSISFVNSSSPFEIECAHLFLLLYIFYTYRDNKKLRIISAFCCVLAWKRMCMIYLVFVTLIHRFIDEKKPISKWCIVAICAVTLIVPSVLHVLLTDSFSDWFTELTGLDLHKFLMFRFETIVTAFEGGTPSRGLGTFLYVDVPWYDHYVHVSIHNDVVRLYLEVSPLGLLIFSAGISSIGKNYYSYLVILFLFMEMTLSHFLGNGTLAFWIVSYSLIFYFNSESSKRDDKLLPCGGS